MIYHAIEQLGLPKTKENQFIKKGLTTLEDIAHFFPRRYIDFRKITKLRDAVPGEYAALEGVMLKAKDGKGKLHTATIMDLEDTPSGYHNTFSVSWFGTNYYISQLKPGKKYIFCGKISEFYGRIQMTAPLVFGQDKDEICRILPVYPKIQGMSNEYLMRGIDNAINFLEMRYKRGEKDVLADSLHLMPKFDAIREVHNPEDMNSLALAKQSVDFGIIYDFYQNLWEGETFSGNAQIPKAPNDELTRKVIASLPFDLTDDQSKVVETFIREAKEGRKVKSLISGDVGCGKTMVAILACVFMKENGFQSIVMAPTLVLARQHFQEFQNICQELDISVGLLTTETKKKERTALLSAFSCGDLDVLIGTHSVLNQEISAKNLGLTIVDEEHKFGVEQKIRLEAFDIAGAHHLSMTATPIPRSIARAIYGTDTRVLSIHSMPAGRKPVITKQYKDADQIWAKIYEEAQLGHQSYVVCPFIEDSDSDQYQDVVSVAAASKMMENYFSAQPNPVRIGVISGDMKQQSILEIVKDFEDGKLDVLLSTTIVEVGVNVPNATVIAVMSAERFGLASLHQLRGRVGRGSEQGCCLLFSEYHKERLDILCGTNDGFVIAEEDLRLRGPGDVAGLVQSGQSEEINAITRHPQLAQIVREKIFRDRS